jgi:hypothetical protein
VFARIAGIEVVKLDLMSRFDKNLLAIVHVGLLIHPTILPRGTQRAARSDELERQEKTSSGRNSAVSRLVTGSKISRLHEAAG